MNRNHLKIIACASMLCDHAGLLLFPQLVFLRWAGRLALPLFAFFIGEGCIYTSNRKKYFLSVFALGVGCQAAYIAEEFVVCRSFSVDSDCWYFNILFTFCLAMAACFLFIDAKRSVLEKNKRESVKNITAFTVYFSCVAGMIYLFYVLRQRGWSVYLDYGLCGVIMPLSVTVFSDKRLKLVLFTAAILLYCFVYRAEMPYVWFSLLSVPLLALYNSEGGSRKLKYLFYVFYPAHLAALYLICVLLN